MVRSATKMYEQLFFFYLYCRDKYLPPMSFLYFLVALWGAIVLCLLCCQCFFFSGSLCKLVFPRCIRTFFSELFIIQGWVRDIILCQLPHL